MLLAGQYWIFYFFLVLSSCHLTSQTWQSISTQPVHVSDVQELIRDMDLILQQTSLQVQVTSRVKQILGTVLLLTGGVIFSYCATRESIPAVLQFTTGDFG